MVGDERAGNKEEEISPEQELAASNQLNQVIGGLGARTAFRARS